MVQALNVNLIGELFIMKDLEIKPNFSCLSRKYGRDRHTIKKYYVNGGINKKQIIRTSKYDDLSEEISELLSNPAVSIIATFHYLVRKYPDRDIKYNGLKSFIRKKGLNNNRERVKPHVRFETNPAEQLQVDWKEDISLATVDGEIITFNVFSATLGFSRLHKFIYSKGRTTEDFLRCTIDVLKQLGGSPKHILTDNMSAVVSITNGTRKKHNIIRQFEKDSGIYIKLCKIKSPQTKGKVESSNRFLNWLNAYNGKIKNESELLEILQYITERVNSTNSQTTNIPPIKLFAKEKEYLLPLNPRILLDSYICDSLTKTVSNTLLVNFDGNEYSVPSKYIGKRVKLVRLNDSLYIYFNTDLIACHQIKDRRFNYLKEHYVDGLSLSVRKDNETIDNMAKSNLSLLDRIYGGNKNE